MAEIRIEKKSSAWIWWIVGLVVLALVIWLIAANDDDEVVSAVETTDVEQAIASDAVTAGNTADANDDNNAFNQYSMWVDDEMNMGRHHEATQVGLQKLATAIAYTIDNNQLNNDMEIRSDLEKMRTMANDITGDWQSTQHADKIKKAFDQASQVIDRIQEKKFSDMNEEVNELSGIANSIDPQVMTLNQKDKVKNFFDKANDILEEMNQNV